MIEVSDRRQVLGVSLLPRERLALCIGPYGMPHLGEHVRLHCAAVRGTAHDSHRRLRGVFMAEMEQINISPLIAPTKSFLLRRDRKKWETPDRPNVLLAHWT